MRRRSHIVLKRHRVSARLFLRVEGPRTLGIHSLLRALTSSNKGSGASSNARRSCGRRDLLEPVRRGAVIWLVERHAASARLAADAAVSRAPPSDIPSCARERGAREELRSESRAASALLAGADDETADRLRARLGAIAVRARRDTDELGRRRAEADPIRHPHGAFWCCRTSRTAPCSRDRRCALGGPPRCDSCCNSADS